MILADRSISVHLPKADIILGTFQMDSQFNEFRNRSGRAPDHYFEKYRKLYWRVDEVARRSEKFIQDQGYFFLPTLDFATYKGCLPLFSAEQLRLHYGRHHRAYVDNLNKLVKGSPFDGQPLDVIIRGSFQDPEHKAIYNNAAQHYNHCFFWKSIHPWGSNIPPDLQVAIEAQYQTLDKFKSAFKQASMNFFGSGWIWFVYDSQKQVFDIRAVENAGCALNMPGVTGLLVLDAWEHAWYQDYENEKAKYVDRYFDAVDWHWAERHWKRATGQEYDEMKWL